ncbi:MAG: hypothetical protein ACYTGH_07570 [Planctomycetota bacterium]
MSLQQRRVSTGYPLATKPVGKYPYSDFMSSLPSPPHGGQRESELPGSQQISRQQDICSAQAIGGEIKGAAPPCRTLLWSTKGERIGLW